MKESKSIKTTTVSLPFLCYDPAEDQFAESMPPGSCEITALELTELKKHLRILAGDLINGKKPSPCKVSMTLAEKSTFTVVAANDSSESYCFFYIIQIVNGVGVSLLPQDGEAQCNIDQIEENLFYEILGSLYEDFTIIDRNGLIEKALPDFESVYGIPPSEAEGCTIFDMEKRKIFNPCVSARVLKTKQPEHMMQVTKEGRSVMCTSIPLFHKDGSLMKVISYTRDITKYEELKEEYAKLQSAVAYYNAEIDQLRMEQEQNAQPIISESPEMRRICQTAMHIAKFNATVLLTGESGVGKSLVANMIHSHSDRSAGPFIAINCGAIPENLLESELFGYENGAFTGAGRDGKPGLVELSNNGTLFLDEIGDLPMHMQVKLLHMIQEKKVTRVGGIEERSVDFRLISATNKDIDSLIENNLFREDLYYRLNVISIRIPSLRERREDIFPLINHFTQKYNEKHKISHVFSSRAIDYLECYNWPGNIRELENVIERTLLTAGDYIITEDSLPYNIYSGQIGEPAPSMDKLTLKEILQNVEKQVILNAYRDHRTTTGIAKALGISQSQASVKLAKYLEK